MNRSLRAALLLLALACGTTRTATVDGRTVAYDEAAQAEFQRARGLQDAGQFELAARAYATFLQKYPDAQLADEALFRRGQSLARANLLVAAQATLQELLEHRPTSPFKGPAAAELAQVQAKLGQKPSQPLPLSTENMSDEDKKRAAAALAQAYAQAGQPGEAVRWAAKAVEVAPDADREARLAEYRQALVEAPAPDVARLVAELDRHGPAWAPAALQLARVQLHVGDRARATELAGEIVSAAGSSSPAGIEATALRKAAELQAEVKPGLVGVVLPLGDPQLKSFAEAALNAIQLAFEGKGPIQLSIKDSKGDPAGAADRVQELYEEGAIAVLGPIGLAEGPAAAARAQQLGVPLVSLSRAEGLTALGDFVFRDMPPASAQARAIADYAQRKLGVKSFGVLAPDWTYGDEVTDAFWSAVEAGGGELRAFEHYPLRTTTFKPFVQRMVGRTAEDLAARKEFSEEAEKIANEIKDPYRRRKALTLLRSQQAPVVDFDALFIPDTAARVRLIAPAIAAEDVITSGCDTRELDVVRKTTKNEQLRTVQLLGTSLWDGPDLVDERSGVARYVKCSIFVDVFFPGSERPATKRFVELFNSAYHRAPGFLEAHAWDAASILKRALERRKPVTRAELRDALAEPGKPFEGAAGDTVFGRDREAQKPFFWLWVDRDRIEEFDPQGTPPVPVAGESAKAQ